LPGDTTDYLAEEDIYDMGVRRDTMDIQDFEKVSKK